ncbi:MAG: hypothetical protein ABWX96_14955 [Propionibacteriaceae bacterium]
MTLILRRAPLVQAMGRAVSRLSRLGAAVVFSLTLVLTVSACGMDVQTNQPYTPAEGVNFDVGDVHVRNLMILSKADGSGILSGSLVSVERDALVSVAGVPITVNGTDGTALKVTIPDPVALGNSVLVVLTQRPFITVDSDELVPGLTARLVLTFSSAGESTVIVPIVDGNQPDYATITPTPSASPSA